MKFKEVSDCHLNICKAPTTHAHLTPLSREQSSCNIGLSLTIAHIYMCSVSMTLMNLQTVTLKVGCVCASVYIVLLWYGTVNK